MADFSSVNNAMAAYGAAVARPVTDDKNGSDGVQTAGSAFKELVSGAVKETVDLSKKSEEMSLKAIAGKASMEDVVSAVANAETALETVVAVRDNVIKAYQEIMRMPI